MFRRLMKQLKKNHSCFNRKKWCKYFYCGLQLTDNQKTCFMVFSRGNNIWTIMKNKKIKIKKGIAISNLIQKWWFQFLKKKINKIRDIHVMKSKSSIDKMTKLKIATNQWQWSLTWPLTNLITKHRWRQHPSSEKSRA